MYPSSSRRLTKFVGEWLSLVEHLVRDQGVGGSNPLSPTNLFKYLTALSVFRLHQCSRIVDGQTHRGRVSVTGVWAAGSGFQQGRLMKAGGRCTPRRNIQFNETPVAMGTSTQIRANA